MAIDSPYDRRAQLRQRRRPRGSAGVSTVSIRLAESIVYPVNQWHIARGLVAASQSRSYFGLTIGSTRWALGIRHQGSGADPTRNASLADATPIEAVLTDGARTATEVATAVAAAITAATGATCVLGASSTVDGVDFRVLTIYGASDLFIAPTMPRAHEDERGMFGCQRTDYGTDGTGTDTPVNGKRSMHEVGHGEDHRAIACYAITSGGAADLRMGVADGPAYSASPSPFSDGVEAVAAPASSDGTRVAVFGEPHYIDGGADVWITYQGSATATVRTRVQGSVAPVAEGNGDFTEGDLVLIDNSAADSTTPIYDGDGEYAPVVSSTASHYPAVGYVYEVADANGDYYGSAGVATWIGTHRPLNAGDGTTAAPVILAQISETFGWLIPMAGRVCGDVRFDLANNTANEDGFFEIYDLTAVGTTATPLVGNAPKLLSHGRCNASTGAGRKTFSTDGVVVAAGTMIGVHWHWGRVGGGALTTVATRYDTTAQYSNGRVGWIDSRTEWCDAVRSGNAEGYGAQGVRRQYLTATTGSQTVGSLSAGGDPFPFHASDTRPGNHFRHAFAFDRPGNAPA